MPYRPAYSSTSFGLAIRENQEQPEPSGLLSQEGAGVPDRGTETRVAVGLEGGDPASGVAAGRVVERFHGAHVHRPWPLSGEGQHGVALAERGERFEKLFSTPG